MNQVKRRNLKIIPEITLVVLIVILGGGIIGAALVIRSLTPDKISQTIPTPTQNNGGFVNVIPLEEGTKSGWKKYINNAQGYSIEFPETYVSDMIVANELQLFDKETTTGIGMGTSKNKLHITIDGPPIVETLGPIKTLRGYIKEGQAIDSNIGKVSWTKINNREVAVEGNWRYYFLNHGYVYIVDKYISDPTMEQEFNQIISSFKFIN